MRKVEARIDIHVEPAKAIDAFLDFDALKGWWGVEKALTESRSGGAYVLAWGVSESGAKYVSTGTIGAFEPARLVQIDNYTYLCPDRPILGQMSLRVEAEPTPSGCSVHVCQSGYRSGADWDWYHDAVTQAWPLVLENLKKYLEK